MSAAAGQTLHQVQDPNAFRREQVEMLYRQIPLMYGADIVAGGFLFVVLLRDDSSLLAYGWYALLFVTTVVRAAMARQHSQHRTADTDIAMRWRFLTVGAVFSGTLWGNAWLLLPALPEFNQAILVGVWLAALQAGAATTMAIIKEVFLAFTISTSLVFLGYLLWLDADFSLLLIAAFIMYLGFILPIALRSGRDFNRTLILQTNNAALQESLTAEEERLLRNQQELEEEKRRHQALQAEKAAADERLRVAAEERLLLLDTVGEGIFGLDNRGNITFINSTALQLLEFGENDLLGQSALKLISAAGNESPANVEAFLAINRCFQHAEPVNNMQCDLLGNNDKKVPVRFSCAPILQNETVAGAVVSFSDVSEQKDMEAMLVQAQKMEAIGRLTGGVAHDFNNLLTVVLGNLQFLRQQLGDQESLLNFVDKTAAAAKRGAELNNRLLSFSREQDLQTDLLEVNEILQDMETLLDRLLGEDIELRLQLSAEEVGVLADQAQLENAILNLAINAKDAMPDGGVLKIETNLVSLQKSYVTGEEGAGEGDFIEISVTDSGIGIEDELLEQIFEPFFTTKEKDSGTGLGLATVYGFIRQSGGNIVVDSEKGKWTTFKVYLPVAETVAISKRESSLPVITDSGEAFSGKILVVEDNDGVREVALHALQKAGYEVVAAEDGRKGLEMFEQHADIDAVFSDVIMPGGLTGIDMAERILEQSPDTPILLATGYTEKSMKDRMLATSHVVFISKPYDIVDLPAMLNSLMKRELPA